MKITVGELRKIVLEESKKLEEAKPFFGVASQSGTSDRRGRSVRRFRGPEIEDPTDVPEPANIGKPRAKGQNVQDARRALNAALKASSNFDVRWHRWVCKSKAGKEMSSVFAELENALKALTRELGNISESRKVTPNELREIVLEEVSKMKEASFLGQFKVPSASDRRQGRRTSQRRKVPDTSVAADTRQALPIVSKVRTLISDMVVLYDTFSPKVRRKMCLGKAGEDLIDALQNLDDMLGKL